ncbi:MAG: heme-copper oxidase subunit III [Deltaproteobacteria bacterium]|nr:heme-copper oxidase subunit III [Deltaproteobacteria bacterium]
MAAPSHSQLPVSNAQLGVVMLIAAETMLFVGLIGAYVMFRVGSVAWPSARLYLPVGVTFLNTLVLLASSYTMCRAQYAAREQAQPTLVRRLTLTAALGVSFLTLQGYEWLQLIHDGLTISTGIYGATFYTLIGCHALHVLAAVTWLGVVLSLALRRRATSEHIAACGMYWQYVCALWLALFVLVYLN